MRSARDFLTTKLHFTPNHAAKVLANLTLNQIKEISTLEPIFKKFQALMHVVGEYSSQDNALLNLVSLLKENNDLYQLKIWHVMKLFNTPIILDEIVDEIRSGQKFASETLGTRQCAHTQNEIVFHFNNIIEKVFPGAYAINLTREEIVRLVPALQSLLEIMNDLMHAMNLNAKTIFIQVINLLADRQLTNVIPEKFKASISMLNLTSAVTAELLGNIIERAPNNRQIAVNLTAKLEELVAMDNAIIKQCNRISYCDYEKRNFIPVLRLNYYFNPDAAQAKLAGKLEQHIIETIDRHDEFCYLTKYPQSTHFQPQNNLSFFKTQGVMKSIHQNLSNYFTTCDFKDTKPFLYFFLPNVIEQVAAPVALITAEAHAADLPYQDKFTAPLLADDANGREYLFLIFIALILLLLMKRKYIKSVKSSIDYELLPAEDDLESDDIHARIGVGI